MSIKAKKLREILEKAINRLEDLEDDAEIEMVSNTYFLGNCYTFLGISGYDGGYVNLDRIKLDEESEFWGKEE